MSEAGEDNVQVVQRYWEEIWNQGRLELIETYCAPDLVESRRYFINRTRQAFSDSHVTIEDVIAAGEKVVVRYSWRGVHTGVWDLELEGIPMNVPPTGKAVWDRGIAIFQVMEGRIVAQWSEWTKLELAQQLGVAPRSQDES